MSTLDLSGSAHVQRMPTTFETRTYEGRFAARFDYRYQALTVLATLSGAIWSVSKLPGLPVLDTDALNAATYVFSAPNLYTVTEAGLITALTTAGYTVT